MSDAARTPEEIRAAIEHTREELAATAAALAERADVKARAHEKLDETALSRRRPAPGVDRAGGASAWRRRAVR
ncbi:MAG: hypothetical protein QOF86_3202 [Baekduia sp.]|jgi:hypothetical protein|nr:hypothetical protein [Baekduia sp.]